MILNEMQLSEDKLARLAHCSIELAEAFTNAENEPGAPWRTALANGLTQCAQVADQIGLRGLNYLSTLLVPHLHNGRSHVDERAHAEVFCNLLVAFCSGLLLPAQAVELATVLKQWPGLAVIPEQFVEMIGSRLRNDAQIHCVIETDEPTTIFVEPVTTITPVTHITDITDINDVTLVNAVEAVTAVPVSKVASAPTQLENLPYLQTPAQSLPVPVPEPRITTNQVVVAPQASVADLISGGSNFTVASDELAMLAEACSDLAEEVTPHLLTLPLLSDLLEQGERVDEPKLAWEALFSEYKERIEYFANAASFVGLKPLEGWLSKLAENIGFLGTNAAQMSEPLRALLMLVPESLQAYFESPSEKTADQAFMLLEDSAWPAPQEGVVLLATVGALAQLSLIGSRQVVERSDDVSPDDVSLQIPQDADVNVVENLLRELPALSTEFSESIVRIAKGSIADLEPAQRIAHTLKGSANTVGVRGIANLTHQLEDILQILSRDKKLPPQMLMDYLSDAADCLAEMSEAVAGLGDPPDHALEIYRSAVSWTNRLVRDGVPSDDLVSEVKSEQNAQLAGESLSEDDVSAPTQTLELTESVETTTKVAEAPEQLTDANSQREEEILRVPSSLIDRMMGLTGEAAIVLAQVQDRLALLEKTRSTIKVDTDRLGSLSDELDHLVDIRGMSMSDRKSASDFDSLELDEYNELHTVSRRIAESGADAKLIDQQLDRDLTAMKDMVAQLERVQTDLREATLQSRMVQVSSVSPRLQRAARQAARMAGKLVDFEVTGGDTSMDSHLLQTLIDPLTHLIRNAVDHGLESDAIRSRSGKPLNGQVILSFERTGRNVRIHCQDDGAGLNLDAIRKRGLERGLLKPNLQYTESEIARLILQPGFSTRDTATQLSGRGVGMDVVYQAVRQLRGTLDIDHIPGRGSRFTLSLPIRMAAVPIIVARSGAHVIGISVRGIEQILPRQDERMQMDAQGFINFDEQRIPSQRLEQLLGLPSHQFVRSNSPEVVLLVRQEDNKIGAVIAPELSQTRNVIVRPLSNYLAKPIGLEGAAVLGDGSVASVVDLPELISSLADYQSGTVNTVGAAPVIVKPAPVCLVVDDSVSVRRSMEYFVKDLGFDVDSASDGIEALGKLQLRKPDIMIVDFEMPRMNGVELTSAVRNEARLSKVPVIMITSRYTEKHKQMAMAAGVSVFLTKPYTEDDLASHIERCLQNVSA
jgi:chemotaxis protein histidine kinase CheA/ActR/RegA family two-component response regulator